MMLEILLIRLAHISSATFSSFGQQLRVVLDGHSYDVPQLFPVPTLLQMPERKSVRICSVQFDYWPWYRRLPSHKWNFKTTKWIWCNAQVLFGMKSFLYEFKLYLIYKTQFLLPLRFRKTGRVLCGGAREIHWATCHNRLTLSKTEEFLKSPCFFRS